MTKEEKQLLLQDLCARLPYHTKIDTGVEGIATLDSTLYEINRINLECGNDAFLPYLRSLSSMTEDEFKELKNTTDLNYDQLELVFWLDGSATLEFYLEEVPQYCVINVFNWLNKKHFDYRGLITMNLAIEAPKNMYNTKTE